MQAKINADIVATLSKTLQKNASTIAMLQVLLFFYFYNTFSKKSPHFSGHFRTASCFSCNLNVQQDEKIDIFFHNLEVLFKGAMHNKY